jgi:hypothetical protein
MVAGMDSSSASSASAGRQPHNVGCINMQLASTNSAQHGQPSTSDQQALRSRLHNVLLAHLVPEALCQPAHCKLAGRIR